MYESQRKKYDEQLRNMNLLSDTPGHGVRHPATSSLNPVRFDKVHVSLHNPELKGSQELEKPEPMDILPPPPFDGEFSGPAIKLLREKRNLSMKQLADTTKIGSRYLELIEEENYKKLPARPYLRGFLVLYAKTLGYEPERLTADYMKRFDAAKNSAKK